MTGDSPCPSPDASVRPYARLVGEGWTARFLADPARLEEMTALYRRLGFEVTTAAVRPEDFDGRCGECPAAICHSYVMIYTKRP